MPISAGLLRNTDQYFAALTAYRNSDVRPIIEMTAAASFSAIANGRQMITNIRDIRQSWNGRIASRKDSAVWKVADLLLRQPVVDFRTIQRELQMGHNNVPRYVDVLVECGILKEFSGFKRNRCWRADEILVELDNFAARAGHRALP